jgi:A/G-specific adenine glycosylase
MAVESMSAELRQSAIRDALTGWYRRAARALPWRSPPDAAQRPDPYRVWLSEVMLQQTTVAAVQPYFARFTAQWPTLADLAAAEPEAVLAAWAGLGYYSRARNLIACARTVAEQHGGAFPADEAALRVLPGVGDYTAAAIAAIAFGRDDAVPVDANIERVVARLFAIAAPLPAGRAAIRAAARALWPARGGGDFAQALMDLGATICTARNPACTRCPAAPWCEARSLGIAADLPVKAAKKAKPHRHGRALWIERGSGAARAVWLVRRPDRWMLGGMRALPGGEWTDSPPPPADAVAATRFIGTVRHVFTHFSLDLAVDRAGDTTLAVGVGEWWPIDRLDAAGLPTLYRRASEIALAGE